MAEGDISQIDTRGTGMKRAVKTALRSPLLRPLQQYVIGPIKMARNAGKPVRNLEIGPGEYRAAGFETVNIVGGWNTDYIADASRRLPFKDATFDCVYASHILEHIAWYRSEEVLREWVRVLKPGGRLEVFVPDGLKIAEAFVEAEREGTTPHFVDSWWMDNPRKDPCLWASGRLMAYGDGKGTRGHFNWHLAIFSERRLTDLFQRIGLTDVRRLGPQDVRGFDHGWINLGVAGVKA